MTAIWRMPVLLAAMILIGLFDALLIDNIMVRAIAWVFLATPIAVAGWIIFADR